MILDELQLLDVVDVILLFLKQVLESEITFSCCYLEETSCLIFDSFLSFRTRNWHQMMEIINETKHNRQTQDDRMHQQTDL